MIIWILIAIAAFFAAVAFFILLFLLVGAVINDVLEEFR